MIPNNAILFKESPVLALQSFSQTRRVNDYRDRADML